jgi:hypothetical protein
MNPPLKTNNMKNLNKVLLATALAATFSLAQNASAQFKPTVDDGIAASPRLRQMLDERAAAARVQPATPNVAITYRNPAAGVTAPPKTLQMLAERKVVVSGTPSAEVAAAGYRPTGSDGVTASPKLRQQLDSRGRTFMVAPVK